MLSKTMTRKYLQQGKREEKKLGKADKIILAVWEHLVLEQIFL